VNLLARYLPLLRSCTIRLGHTPVRKNLASLAHDTAMGLMGRAETPVMKPFPFGRLPRELKLAVLKYTHFGPAELAGYAHRFGRIEVWNGRLLRGRVRGTTSLSVVACCYQCSESFMDW